MKNIIFYTIFLSNYACSSQMAPMYSNTTDSFYRGENNESSTPNSQFDFEMFNNNLFVDDDVIKQKQTEIERLLRSSFDEEILLDETVLDDFQYVCNNDKDWLLSMIDSIIQKKDKLVARNLISLLIETDIPYEDASIGRLMLYALNTNDWPLQYAAIQLKQTYNGTAFMGNSYLYIGNNIQEAKIADYYFSRKKL